MAMPDDGEMHIEFSEVPIPDTPLRSSDKLAIEAFVGTLKVYAYDFEHSSHEWDRQQHISALMSLNLICDSLITILVADTDDPGLISKLDQITAAIRDEQGRIAGENANASEDASDGDEA